MKFKIQVEASELHRWPMSQHWPKGHLHTMLFVAMSQELGPMNKPHQNYEPPVQRDNAGIVSDKLACSLAT